MVFNDDNGVLQIQISTDRKRSKRVAKNDREKDKDKDKDKDKIFNMKLSEEISNSTQD